MSIDSQQAEKATDEPCIARQETPAEEWTLEQRADSITELSEWDYVPITPESVTFREVLGPNEARAMWMWTWEGSYRAVMNAWPGEPV